VYRSRERTGEAFHSLRTRDFWSFTIHQAAGGLMDREEVKLNSQCEFNLLQWYYKDIRAYTQIFLCSTFNSFL